MWVSELRFGGVYRRGCASRAGPVVVEHLLRDRIGLHELLRTLQSPTRRIELGFALGNDGNRRLSFGVALVATVCAIACLSTLTSFSSRKQWDEQAE